MNINSSIAGLDLSNQNAPWSSSCSFSQPCQTLRVSICQPISSPDQRTPEEGLGEFIVHQRNRLLSREAIAQEGEHRQHTKSPRHSVHTARSDREGGRRKEKEEGEGGRRRRKEKRKDKKDKKERKGSALSPSTFLLAPPHGGIHAVGQHLVLVFVLFPVSFFLFPFSFSSSFPFPVLFLFLFPISFSFFTTT